MRFSTLLSTLALISGTFATDAAADNGLDIDTEAVCYNHSNGDKCIDRDQLEEHGRIWCQSNWDKLNGAWTNYRDSAGAIANIGKIKNFGNQELCNLVFKKIVDDCDGAHGGVWTENGVSLNINLCSW